MLTRGYIDRVMTSWSRWWRVKDARLRAAAVFPFGSDGRLTIEAAEELARLLATFLGSTLSVKELCNRITIEATEGLASLIDDS